MRLFSFYIVGILFGIIMSKSEAISWYRIHEMFRFESFHMYGIIGVAVVMGMIIIAAMKKLNVKTWRDTKVSYNASKMSPKFLIGGSIFGLGWGLMGACPGPIFVMLGQGFWIFILVIISATLGTYTYGAIKDKLPH